MFPFKSLLQIMVLALVLHYALNYKLTAVFYTESQCVLELNDWSYVAKENVSEFQCRHGDTFFFFREPLRGLWKSLVIWSLGVYVTLKLTQETLYS